MNNSEIEKKILADANAEYLANGDKESAMRHAITNDQAKAVIRSWIKNVMQWPMVTPMQDSPYPDKDSVKNWP